MNLSRAQKIRLAVFMLLGITVLVGALGAMIGLSLYEERHEYTVRFTESVGGLEVSSPVKYQGLRVGRVESIQVAPDDPAAIEVRLSVATTTVLYVGTEAALDSSGLTGLKTINLSAGDPREGVIPPGSRLKSGGSMLEKLKGQAEAVGLKLELIANQLSLWTSDDNRVRVEKMVQSVTTLSGDMSAFLRTNREPLRQTLVEVSSASKAFTGVATSSERGIAAVRKDIERTLEEARRTIQEIRKPFQALDAKEITATINATKKAMQSIDRRVSGNDVTVAIAQMQKALKKLTTLVEETELAVRSGRQDFTSTLSYLRQAAEDVREFSRIISQDPSVLLRGRE